jgi:beta-lactamase class A
MRHRIKRIYICFSVILFIGACVFAQSGEKTSVARLTDEIERFENITGGSVGVGAIQLKTGKSFYYNENIRYPMASTYKVSIAVQLLSLVEKEK